MYGKQARLHAYAHVRSIMPRTCEQARLHVVVPCRLEEFADGSEVVLSAKFCVGHDLIEFALCFLILARLSLCRYHSMAIQLVRSVVHH